MVVETAAPTVAIPPRAQSRLAPGVLVVALMVGLTGVVIFVVGALDFLGGRQIDARLLGALNLVAGGVWISAAFGFRHRTIVSLGIVVAGALLALAFAIYYGWQWWRFGSVNEGVLVLTIWMAVVAAAMSLVVWRTWRDYGLTEQTRRRFGAGQIGIPVLATLGTLGALFQVWSNAAYGPSALPPNLVVEAKLTPAGQQASTGMRAYSVTVDISNVGESRVQVLASWYDLSTFMATELDPADTLKAGLVGSFERTPYILEAQPHRAERHVSRSLPQPVGAGELLMRGWWFEPGESSHVQFLSFVDPAEGDMLHLVVGLDIARGNRLKLDDRPPPFSCAADPEPVDVMGWTSAEPSAIRSVAIPQVHIAYGWQTSEDGTLGFATCYGVGDRWYGPPLPGVAPDPILDVLEQEYGLTATTSEAQVTLWPSAGEAPGP